MVALAEQKTSWNIQKDSPAKSSPVMKKFSLLAFVMIY
jgi:hypothetical protein